MSNVEDVFNDVAFVIKASEGNIFEDCYIGHNDVFVAKIKTAKIFKDEMVADHELKKICERNKKYEAYNKELLKPVPVRIIEIDPNPSDD